MADATDHLVHRRKYSTKRDKHIDQMMRCILMQANPIWRDQRSTNARLPGLWNENKIKRRRAGVVHTNRGSLMTKWSGCQRWRDSCVKDGRVS